MLISTLPIAGIICLVALSIFDLRHGRLPNWLNGCLAASGLLYLLISKHPSPSALDVTTGLIMGPGVFLLIRMAYFKARGQHALGLGDAKFVCAAACWVGVSGLPVLLFIASSATFLGVGLSVWIGRVSTADLAATRIPFGPGLAVGLVTAFCLRHFALFP